jgi:hypothetical protein
MAVEPTYFTALIVADSDGTPWLTPRRRLAGRLPTIAPGSFFPWAGRRLRFPQCTGAAEALGAMVGDGAGLAK